MDYKKAKQLLKKYRQGQCTPEEVALLESWFNHVVKNVPEYDKKINYGAVDSELKQRLYPLGKSGYTLKKTYYWVAAASVILMIGAFAFFQWRGSMHQRLNEKLVDALPGKERAELILADGSTISLEEAATGELAEEGATHIKKTAAGKLVYEPSKSPMTMSGKPKRLSGINEIRVPKSGQYHLILPDGSKVWLNASSKLTYDSQYEPGSPRIVSLIGEAYFEVAKQVNGKRSVPFIVKTEDQEIHVLGTSFNINAYADEPYTRTTLTEGKVAIQTRSGSSKRILYAGQDAVLSHGQSVTSPENISVESSDIKQALAWKNDLFVFDNVGLKALMRQVSRWYDVEVDIETLPDEHFNGEMSRSVNLSQLLDMIAIASDIKFKLELINGTERRLIRQQ